MDCSWVRKGIALRVGAGMRGRPPLSSCNPCSAAPTLRHAPGLPLMFLILFHYFGAGALGEELVSVSGVLPPVIPKRIGLPSRPVDRPLVIISTLDGSIHALEVNTGVLRWTVPSGDPLVNFRKPDGERRDKKKIGGENDRKDGPSSESTDVVRVNSDIPWKEQATPHSNDDDFEGFIPVYSGVPGGGFLQISDDGNWRIFERTAEELVGMSPWYDKGSRGIIVGTKITKVHALDAESGKSHWVDDKDEACKSPGSRSDTIIITRSMYSIKVRNAKTGSLFWNVSISEFKTHDDATEQAPGEPSMEEALLLVSSTKGDEVMSFDRSSGQLQWRHKLSAAAVSAHLWDRSRTIEVGLHAQDQAELVVASDSTSLAATSAIHTVHVHKHDGAMYARLYSPMRVPAPIAQKIVDVTGSSTSNPPIGSALQTPLSTHVDELAVVEQEVLVKRDPNAMACKPKLPGYPDCLIGTYDIRASFGDVMPDQQAGGGGRVLQVGRPSMAGEASASKQGRMWPENEFLDPPPNRQKQMEQLLHMAAETPMLFLGLVFFLILLGWWLGRRGSKAEFGGIGGPSELREMRMSEASSCNSLPDLQRLVVPAPQLIENGTIEQPHVHTRRCNLKSSSTRPCDDLGTSDRDSGSLSKATTPGEHGEAMVKVSSLTTDLSNSSWGDKWTKSTPSGSENGRGGVNNSFSYTDSDADDFNTESIDQISSEMMRRCGGSKTGVSSGSSREASRISSATTASATTAKTQYGKGAVQNGKGAVHTGKGAVHTGKGGMQKGQAKGKQNPTLYIPDPVWPSDMKALCAQLDNDSSWGGKPSRKYSGLSREGSSEHDDDESDRRVRSISLGSHLSARSKIDLQHDLDAALAACSAPNSPKTTPALGKPMSPGFPLPYPWPNESRYQKDFIELGRIGKGAFGSVYRVKQRLDEREYAVKKVRLEKDLRSSDNQRIMREVRSFSILSDHPKIVRYYGTWQEQEMPQNDGQDSTMDGSSEVTWDASSFYGDESERTNVGVLEPVNWLYIQMELCSTSLRQLLSASGADAWMVDRDTIRAYLHDVAEGLSYIHSKHYIHRDMKPDNIFIVNNHGNFVAKLGDFGLSCKTTPEKSDGSGTEACILPTPGHVLQDILMRRDGDKSRIGLGGSFGEEDKDAASMAELTRACGTRMYFSPELEHSGVYNQLVDVYALGIVIFEMMHVFKTGMERIKVIEQLKGAMCTQSATEFSALPLNYILLHSDPLIYENGRRVDSSRANPKPSTPDTSMLTRRRRPFEASNSDSDSAESASSPVAARGTSQLSAFRPPPIDCKFAPALPGLASPERTKIGSFDKAERDEARREQVRAQVQRMTLPTEVMDLFERFEFEVCLLLRLLSQAPERRPSAKDMRDDLYMSIERDRAQREGSSGHTDKGGEREVQKLRQELAELKKNLGGKGSSSLSIPSCAMTRRSMSVVDLRVSREFSSLQERSPLPEDREHKESTP